MINNSSINEQIKMHNVRMEDIFLSEDSFGLDKHDEARFLGAFWDAYQPLAYFICREANRIAGEPMWAVDPILRVVERATIPKEYETVYVVPDEETYD
ncbi:MAG: hypothetical protein Q4C76_02560 [Bacillota bacterium]|nr:hypothetical protein [Bacillota bacterium]